MELFLGIVTERAIHNERQHGLQLWLQESMSRNPRRSIQSLKGKVPLGEKAVERFFLLVEEGE
eukprot:10607281-Prorocentrum_lima.AAC.1